MSFQESYCPSCAAIAGKGLPAPPDYYRCPSCRHTMPRHLLPSRTVHRALGATAPGSGGSGAGGNPLDWFILDDALISP
jgi:hypothetical protein